MTTIQRTFVFYDAWVPGAKPGEPGRFEGEPKTGVFWSDGPGVGRRWVSCDGKLVLIRPVHGRYVRASV